MCFNASNTISKRKDLNVPYSFSSYSVACAYIYIYLNVCVCLCLYSSMCVNVSDGAGQRIILASLKMKTKTP